MNKTEALLVTIILTLLVVAVLLRLISIFTKGCIKEELREHFSDISDFLIVISVVLIVLSAAGCFIYSFITTNIYIPN